MLYFSLYIGHLRSLQINILQYLNNNEHGDIVGLVKTDESYLLYI